MDPAFQAADGGLEVRREVAAGGILVSAEEDSVFGWLRSILADGTLEDRWEVRGGVYLVRVRLLLRGNQAGEVLTLGFLSSLTRCAFLVCFLCEQVLL